MSILDFTTGLFRGPAGLVSFIDDPDQALDDAELIADERLSRRQARPPAACG